MSDDSPSVMKRLKAETSDLHSHAESRSLQRGIASGEIDRATFAAYLGQLFIAHSALEKALERGRALHAAIGSIATADRMRVPDLLSDLGFWGMDPDEIEAGDSNRRFADEIRNAEATDPVALLGALYVLEGSTNGGRFLARALRKAWDLENDGLAYFDPYGDEQPHRWAAFKRDMEAASFNSEQETAIVEMAKRTFLAIAEVSDEVAQRLAA